MKKIQPASAEQIADRLRIPWHMDDKPPCECGVCTSRKKAVAIIDAGLQAHAQEIATLRAALASAQADYEELKRVTKLLQMGNRSGRRR